MLTVPEFGFCTVSENVKHWLNSRMKLRTEDCIELVSDGVVGAAVVADSVLDNIRVTLN